jgi:hypothetical protein
MSQTTSTTAADRRDAREAASAPDEDGVFTHRQILTIVAGLMVAMFLAALDQTVVSTAIRTIADDLQGYDLQAWATTAFLITSTISTPLYGKALRHLRAAAVLPVRHRRLRRRLGAVRASRTRCTSWPPTGRSRASAPAA